MFPEAIEGTMGCHISEDKARFDFRIPRNFTSEEMEEIIQKSNDYVKRALDIHIFPHEKETEALFWECDGEIIPCGGTHLTNTRDI